MVSLSGGAATLIGHYREYPSPRVFVIHDGFPPKRKSKKMIQERQGPF